MPDASELFEDRSFGDWATTTSGSHGLRGPTPAPQTKSWGRALSNKQKAVLNMSRYFFDVKNGHRLVDSTDCSDDKEAISSAQTIARLIAREAPTGAERKVAVVDDEGREVGAVLVEDDEK
jgi:hypothetical protein